MSAGPRRHFGIMVLALATAPLGAAPSVFPTGTTINEAAATWPGYTVLSPLRPGKVVVIDMDGRVVKEWSGYDESAGGPARLLPGGEVIAAEGARPGHQESLALVQRAFDGTEIWRLAQNETITLADGRQVASLRQHHDWQRADLPAGYYSPEARPASRGARTLVLTHVSRTVPGSRRSSSRTTGWSSSTRPAGSPGSGARPITSTSSASMRPRARRSARPPCGRRPVRGPGRLPARRRRHDAPSTGCT